MTRDEAVEMVGALLDAAHAMRYMIKECDEGEITATRTRFHVEFERIIAALTAAPRVDVRKVWGRVMREAHRRDRQPDDEMLAKSLRAAGVEVVE